MSRPARLARLSWLGIISVLAGLAGTGLAGLAGLAVAAGAPQAGWQLGLLTPRYLVVGGASAPLAAQVHDAAGRPAPDGTRVTFVASLGLTVNPPAAETQDGLAVTRLVSGTEAGFAQLDAVVDGERANSLLWVRPGPAAHLVRLTAEPSQLPAGGRSVITGQLADRYGNPAEGDGVQWSVAGGTLVEASEHVDHGAVRAVFLAGPGPAQAQVGLQAAEATGRVAIQVAHAAPPRPALPLWLPLVVAAPLQAAGCTDLLANGGFEADANGDGLADGWSVMPGSGPWPRLVPEAAEGDWSVRLVGDEGATPSGLRQSLTPRPGARDGQLWLWARGAPVGGGLRLAIWSTVTVGDGAVRAPILVRHVALPEASWERLAFQLPAPPSGPTTVELEPWSEDASPPLAEVDGLALRACW